MLTWHSLHTLQGRNSAAARTVLGDARRVRVAFPRVDGVTMKQGLRFFVNPKMFFNQLQWSRHHFAILVAFLCVAVVETQSAVELHAYDAPIQALTELLHGAEDAALFLFMTARVLLLAGAAYLLAELLWFAGGLLGKSKSKRVLFRRLGIVYTVLLASHTAHYLMYVHPFFGLVSVVLLLWTLALGYWALREHFSLNHMEAVVLGVFALLAVAQSYQFSSRVSQNLLALRSIAPAASSSSASSTSLQHVRP